MEVIPPCVSYGGTPITFDVDKFIVSLIGKGFPAERIGNDARVVISDSIYQRMHPDEIRLVLLHELCHTKHTAHGRTFFTTLEDMLLRVGLLTEEEKNVQYFYPKHRGIIDFESLPLRKYRGSF